MFLDFLGAMHEFVRMIFEFLAYVRMGFQILVEGRMLIHPCLIVDQCRILPESPRNVRMRIKERVVRVCGPAPPIMGCAITGPAIANASAAADNIVIPRFIFMGLRPLG